jgi:hypothetical protein
VSVAPFALDRIPLSVPWTPTTPLEPRMKERKPNVVFVHLVQTGLLPAQVDGRRNNNLGMSSILAV